MQHTADGVTWGGEIVNNEPGGQHTSTVMGSGAFSSAWFDYAAYHRHLQYVDTNYNTIDPSLTMTVTDSNCYDLTWGISTPGDGWGHFAFFGGPGYSANCM